MQYRQGDVFIESITAAPEGVKKVARDKGRIVLAYGEVTGHAHAIAEREADLYHDPGTQERFLRVLADAGVALRHEEHATITLPPGDYRVRTQREYTPWGERQVAD